MAEPHARCRPDPACVMKRPCYCGSAGKKLQLLISGSTGRRQLQVVTVQAGARPQRDWDPDMYIGQYHMCTHVGWVAAFGQPLGCIALAGRNLLYLWQASTTDRP